MDEDYHTTMASIYEDEIEALIARPPSPELVFINNPSMHGGYSLDVNLDLANSGLHRLHPKKRQNDLHLEIEVRVHEILSHVRLWPETAAAARTELEDRAFTALGELDLRKATMWWRQRHPPSDGLIITDHLFQPTIPAHPHIAGAFLTVVALASTVSRDQLRLILASYRDGAAATPEIASQIPKDPRTVLHRMQLEPVCDIFVVCPSCFALYALHGEVPPPFTCSYKATAKSKPCNEMLWRQKQTTRVPLRTFVHQNFDMWLARLLSRPDIERHLENTYRRPKQDPMISDWDGDRLSAVCGLDGHPFLPGPAAETRLVFAWSHDGWNPYYNKAAGVQYSCTGVWLVCMSLPESIRYFEENVYYLGSLPGKPSQEQINPVLSLIVRIFTKYYAGVWFSKTAQHPHGRHVKAIVVPQVSDALATRQGAGQSVLTSKRLCIFCGIEHDDIECFDRNAWPQRDSLLQREIAQRWRKARTETKRRTIFQEHGLNYTPFHELPYYDPLLDNLPDAPHLGLQGLGKDLLMPCLGMHFGSPRLVRCRTYARPAEKTMRKFYKLLLDAVDEEKRDELVKRISASGTRAGVAWSLSWDLDLRLVGSKALQAKRIRSWRIEASDASLDLLQDKLANTDEEEAVFIGRGVFRSNKAKAPEPLVPLVPGAPNDVEVVAFNDEGDEVEDNIVAEDVDREGGDEDEDVVMEGGTGTDEDAESAIVTSADEQSVFESDMSSVDEAVSEPSRRASDRAAAKRRERKEARLDELAGFPDTADCAALFLQRKPLKDFKPIKKEVFQALCRAQGLPWNKKKADLIRDLRDWVTNVWGPPESDDLGEGRDTLDLATMQYIWREMLLTLLPSFINAAPPNWGTKTRGKISSDEYFVLITIHLPITLIDLWGRLPQTERRRRLLDHLMDLVDIEFTIFSNTVSREETYALDDASLHYMLDKLELFKDVTIKVNDHTAMHYGEVLRNFGPTPSHDGSYYERFIRSMHNVNINMKPSELESTLMNCIVRHSNLLILLTERAELLDHMPHFVQEYRKQAGSDPRGTRLGNLQLQSDSASTDDGARYELSRSVHLVLSPVIYSLVVTWYMDRLGGASSTVVRDAVQVGRVAIRGAPFTSARISRRDCNILYTMAGMSGAAVHNAGKIDSMVAHTHQGRTTLLLFVHPYAAIPPEKSELDEHYRRYKRGGFCCLRSFTPLEVIDSSSVVCNVSVTPKVINGENVMHFLPVGQLARRLQPSYTYEPLLG